MLSSSFQSHDDLARLPYFERVAPGRLTLASAGLGPAIDMHTHLALSYLRTDNVDLEQEHPHTQHYLPVDRSVELDVYANRNYTAEDVRRMKLDLTLLSVTSGGMRRTHTAPNLLREMADLGIARSVLLPIDMPAISDNAGSFLARAAAHPGLISFGSVHPLSRDLAGRLDRQLEQGARGVKVHPASQMIRPDHGRAMELYRLCGERGLPVLFHCGPVGIEPRPGRRRSQVRLYEAPIALHQQVTFVLGHSGALQFDEALALAQRYENVWLETSSQSLSNVRRLVREAPPDRVVFGSDWPFYPQAVALAKVLLATEEDEEARRRVLFDNAARLLGLEAESGR